MIKEDFLKILLDYIHNSKNKITDNNEEVSNDLFYSKAVRVICVLDEAFDDSLDGLISCFYADMIGQNPCKEPYHTGYGEIIISQKTDGSVTVTFAAEENN